MTDQDQTTARERAARAAVNVMRAARAAENHMAVLMPFKEIPAARQEEWLSIGRAVVDAVAVELGAAPAVVPRSTRPWRQGRRVQNHVYHQFGEAAADTDRWVGSFPVAHDALIAVTAVNAVREAALARPATAVLGVPQVNAVGLDRAAKWLLLETAHYMPSGMPNGVWHKLDESARDYWRGLARAVLESSGVRVTGEDASDD